MASSQRGSRAAAPIVRVSAIGTCAIALGRARIKPDAAVLFALLLYLAIRAGTRVTRTELLALLWGDAEDQAQRHSLRQMLYRIRRAGLAFDVDGDDLSIEPVGIAADLAALQSPDWVTAVPLREIPSPLSILPGYRPDLTPAFAEWVDTVRADAAGQIRRAALRHVATSRREGRWEDVETAARLCLAADPLNEEATLALAEATAMEGSKAEALRVLDAYLWEIGEKEKSIGLPVKLLRRRISDQPAFRTQRTGEPSLIARADDVAWLNAQLDIAAAGVNHTAMLVGPPGIGKSAVVRSFTAHAEMRGWRIAISRLQPSDADRPMSVFVELLPALFKLDGALGAAPESIAQLRRLVEHLPEDDILAGKSQEAEAVQARIRKSALDLIGAVTHEGPLILVLEDLHWIDSQSLRLLGWLNEHSEKVAVLWLVTARPESRFPMLRETLPADRAPARIVEPLGASDAVALFAAFSPTGGDPSAFAQLAYPVTGGNPLFIREVAGHWFETGVTSRLPSSLRTLIRERVARMSAGSQRVLHCCAVLGRFATVPRVSTVLGVTTVELLAAIEEIDGLGLLGLNGEPGSLALHDLWQEELMASMRTAARALLHLRSGEVLEAECAENRSASIVSEAARHLMGAGARERALALLEDGADHQLANGMSEDAVGCLGLAIASTTNPSDRLRLEKKRISALLTLDDWREIGLAVGTVRQLGAELGIDHQQHDENELIEIESRMLTTLNLHFAVERAAACVTAQSASPLHRATAARLGSRAAANEADAEHLTMFWSAARNIDPVTPEVGAELLSVKTIYHTELGSIKEALRHADDMVSSARTSGAVRALIRALRYRSVPLRLTDNCEAAMNTVTEAYSLACSHGIAADIAAGAEMISTMHFERGDLGAATQWLVRCEPWLKRLGADYNYASANVTRAMIALEAGDIAVAEVHAPGSLEEIELISPLRHRLFFASIVVRIHLARANHVALAPIANLLRESLEKAWRFRKLGYFVASLALATANLESHEAAKKIVRHFGDREHDPEVRPWRELSPFL